MTSPSTWVKTIQVLSTRYRADHALLPRWLWIGSGPAPTNRDVHRRRAGGLAHRLRRAAQPPSTPRMCRLPGGQRATATSRGQDPAARRAKRAPQAAHRLPVRARGRAGASTGSTEPWPTASSSTQYIRHHSVPLYTPEPDVIHEVVGHGNCLAHDRFAALYRMAGQAARRVQATEALEFVSKVFWFSLEFGVVRERGQVRTYGAGLLSSYGRSSRSNERSSGRWMSDGWAYRPTTSTTSRCCCAEDSMRSRTWWARSSRTWTTRWWSG